MVDSFDPRGDARRGVEAYDAPRVEVEAEGLTEGNPAARSRARAWNATTARGAQGSAASRRAIPDGLSRAGPP